MTRSVTSRGRLVRNVVAAIAMAGAITFGYVVRVVQAHDQRIDEAFLALEKAEALVDASQTGGGVTPHVQNKFDRHLDSARQHIERAMEQLLLAADTVDNP